MKLPEVSEGMRVRLGGPEDHPLHGATGVAVRIFSPAELWDCRPADMMDVPFAWPDGQVLVSLDERPRGSRADVPWTPVVTVSPADIEPA